MARHARGGERIADFILPRLRPAGPRPAKFARVALQEYEQLLAVFQLLCTGLVARADRLRHRGSNRSDRPGQPRSGRRTWSKRCGYARFVGLVRHLAVGRCVPPMVASSTTSEERGFRKAVHAVVELRLVDLRRRIMQRSAPPVVRASGRRPRLTRSWKSSHCTDIRQRRKYQASPRSSPFTLRRQDPVGVDLTAPAAQIADRNAGSSSRMRGVDRGRHHHLHQDALVASSPCSAWEKLTTQGLRRVVDVELRPRMEGRHRGEVDDGAVAARDQQPRRHHARQAGADPPRNVDRIDYHPARRAAEPAQRANVAVPASLISALIAGSLAIRASTRARSSGSAMSDRRLVSTRAPASLATAAVVSSAARRRPVRMRSYPRAVRGLGAYRARMPPDAPVTTAVSL